MSFESDTLWRWKVVRSYYTWVFWYTISPPWRYKGGKIVAFSSWTRGYPARKGWFIHLLVSDNLRPNPPLDAHSAMTPGVISIRWIGPSILLSPAPAPEPLLVLVHHHIKKKREHVSYFYGCRERGHTLSNDHLAFSRRFFTRWFYGPHPLHSHASVSSFFPWALLHLSSLITWPSVFVSCSFLFCII
jgi:hypothetical protein